MNGLQMDKASIIGDAVLYVQDLQTQAKKLKAEVAELEASLSGGARYQESKGHTKRSNAANAKHIVITKTIIQVRDQTHHKNYSYNQRK